MTGGNFFRAVVENTLLIYIFYELPNSNTVVEGLPMPQITPKQIATNDLMIYQNETDKSKIGIKCWEIAK